MKYLWICLLFFCALVLETTFFAIPFVLVCVLLCSILYKESWIFLAAFFSGIFLDISTFRSVGTSSIFFVGMLGVIFLYQRKFEIQSLPFSVFFSFLAIVVYESICASTNIFVQAIIGVLLTGGIYMLVAVFHQQRLTLKSL